MGTHGNGDTATSNKRQAVGVRARHGWRWWWSDEWREHGFHSRADPPNSDRGIREKALRHEGERPWLPLGFHSDVRTLDAHRETTGLQAPSPATPNPFTHSHRSLNPNSGSADHCL